MKKARGDGRDSINWDKQLEIDLKKIINYKK